MKEAELDKEAWLAEPFTQRMAEKLKQQKSHRFFDLLGACRKSQDPDVVKTFMRYEGIMFLEELFANGDYRDE